MDEVKNFYIDTEETKPITQPIIGNNDSGKRHQILFVNLDPHDIIIPSDYGRKGFSQEGITFESCCQSVKQVGILNPPLVHKINDAYELVSGLRRIIAAKNEKFKKILCRVVEAEQAKLLFLIENIMREDLNDFDEARVYELILREYDIKQKELANIVGKSTSNISATLSLNKLPDKIKEDHRKNNIVSKRKLVEIAKLGSSEKQIDTYKKAKSKKDKPREKPKIAENLKNRIRQIGQFVHKLDINDINPEEIRGIYDNYISMNREIAEKLWTIPNNNSSIKIILTEMNQLTCLVRSVFQEPINKKDEKKISNSLRELRSAITGIQRKKSHAVNFLRHLRDFFRKKSNNNKKYYIN